jgi:hypothetical protein
LELGHNVIMSCEVCGWLKEYNAFELLLSSLVGFDVTIVLAYLYYHEWLPSLYFQQNILQKNFRNIFVTPTFENYMDKIFLSQVDYEDEDDKNIMNATTANTTDGVLLTRMVREHQTLAGMLIYSKHFDKVVIFDIQGPNGGGVDDLVTNFVCRALPTAVKTCQLLQLQLVHQGTKKNAESHSTTHEQSSTEMESTILSSFVMLRIQQSPRFAIQVAKQKLTKKKLFLQKAKTVKRIFNERYFPSRNSTLAGALTVVGEESIPPTVPMTCPSVEKLDKLLRMTIVSDKFITSRREWQDLYYYPPVGDGAAVDSNYTDRSDEDRLVWLLETRLTRNSYIRERFAKSVGGQKFCSLDLNAIQSDPFWIDFLDSSIRQFSN